jgi:hypothetical protein
MSINTRMQNHEGLGYSVMDSCGDLISWVHWVVIAYAFQNKGPVPEMKLCNLGRKTREAVS